MTLYTVTSDYFATGEGRTLSLWMGRAFSAQEALGWFRDSLHGGDYFVQGAIVSQGFIWDDPVVADLTNRLIRQQLEDPGCNRSFSAQLHFNYS